MDPFDWYHLLMPLAVVVCAANFLLGLSLKPEHRSSRLVSTSIIVYLGCLVGVALMCFAFILKPMSLLVKVAILGWLVLLPSIAIGMIFCILRLVKNKNCYHAWASHCMNLIQNIFKFCAFVFAKLINLIFFCLSRKPSNRTLQVLEEDEQRKKSPYLFGGPVFGYPQQNPFGGVDPKHDQESSI